MKKWVEEYLACTICTLIGIYVGWTWRGPYQTPLPEVPSHLPAGVYGPCEATTRIKILEWQMADIHRTYPNLSRPWAEKVKNESETSSPVCEK